MRRVPRSVAEFLSRDLLQGEQIVPSVSLQAGRSTLQASRWTLKSDLER